jgi:cell division ATPase FtsA
MEQKNFIEALCASSNGVVVERRRSIIIPLVVLLVGLGILVINYLIKNGDDANNLKSALVLVGGATTLIGAALCATRIFGGGAPYHTTDRCFLVHKRYSFDKSVQAKILESINNCDKIALDAIQESDIAGLTVECYYSPCSKFCAMQAFAFEELVYKSVSELKVKRA